MSTRNRRLVVSALAALALGALSGCDPQPHLRVVVDDPGDRADAEPGDEVCEATPGQGDCTLRAAIQEANADPALDHVTIAAGVRPEVAAPLPSITGPLDLRGNGAVIRQRIVHEAGHLTLRRLHVSGVDATEGCGGGIASHGERLLLDHVAVTGNTTADGADGAGVCATGDLSLLATTVSGNRIDGATAASSGGGVHAGGDLTVVNSTLDDNDSGAGTGGALGMGDGRIEIVNSTITGNRGAGVTLHAPTAVGRITSSTISGASHLNAAITVSGSVLDLCVAETPPVSGGHNTLNVTCGPPHPTDIGSEVPALDRLNANGGPTRTMSPQAWSPLLDAIPAGTPLLCDGTLPVDQRGRPRPADGPCDIGAVEVQSTIRSGTASDIEPTNGAQGVVTAANDAGTTVGYGWNLPVPFVDVAFRWDAAGTREVLGVVDGSDSQARDVGASGVAVGFQTVDGVRRAFRWDVDGTGHDLGALPGDTTSVATAVNDLGLIVGTSSGGGNGTRGWWRDPATGALTALPTLGGPVVSVAAVNDAGIAVGATEVSGGAVHAARWDLSTGGVTDLGLVGGATSSRATDINDAGVIVGTLDRPDLGDACADLGSGESCPDTRAFHWHPATGTIAQLDRVGGPLARGVGVNDSGVVLATVDTPVINCSACPQREWRPYVYDPATDEALALPTGSIFRATDLTDGGRVVGHGLHSAGYPVTFSEPWQLQLSSTP